MVLTPTDVIRITSLGYKLKEFASISNDGLLRLKNREGYCIFFNPDTKSCKIYKWRPKGCKVYPIIYLVEDNMITVDNECTMYRTVTQSDLIEVLPEVICLLHELGIELNLNRLRVKLRE